MNKKNKIKNEIDSLPFFRMVVGSKKQEFKGYN